jgi:hypothetical protein
MMEFLGGAFIAFVEREIVKHEIDVNFSSASSLCTTTFLYSA